MENKKTKLTISGSSKKNPFKKFDTSKSQGKKTVVISNQNNKKWLVTNPGLYCAVIVKKVDERTRSKTSINELLRD